MSITLRPVVRDARRRDVPALPAGAHRAVAEVDVLDIVAVALVPAAELVQHRAAQEQERAEQPVRLHGPSGPLAEVVVRALALERREQPPQRRPSDDRARDGGEAPARRLPRPVRPERRGPAIPQRWRVVGEAGERADRSAAGTTSGFEKSTHSQAVAAMARLTFSASERGRAFSSTRTPVGHRRHRARHVRHHDELVDLRASTGRASSSRACPWDTTIATTLIARAPPGRP